jgi:hypothetical protein
MVPAWFAAKLTLPGAHSSAGERPLHTREVAGSNPAVPTIERPWKRGLSLPQGTPGPGFGEHDGERRAFAFGRTVAHVGLVEKGAKALRSDSATSSNPGRVGRVLIAGRSPALRGRKTRDSESLSLGPEGLAGPGEAPTEPSPRDKATSGPLHLPLRDGQTSSFALAGSLAPLRAERGRPGTLDVTIPRAPSNEQAQREIALYLKAWQAMVAGR